MKFLKKWCVLRQKWIVIGLVLGVLAPTGPAAAQLVCTFNQVTNTTGFGNFDPSINADGTRIAFMSNRDVTGGNPDLNPEVFLFDTITGVTQVTNTTTGFGNSTPSINADGTRIAFISNKDLTGGNPDLNSEIFLFDTTSNLFTQVTSTTVGSIGLRPRMSINADGTSIVFTSNRDLTGGNADLSTEVFLFATASGFTQVTSGATNNHGQASINADGTRIAFFSDLDPTGGNPDLNVEIFLFDTASGFTQVTNTTTGFGHAQPSINANGTRVAFISIKDLTGGNPDLNPEIFLFDTITGLTQVTSSIGGSSEEPSINADGTRIAFESKADLTGGNPDLSEETFLFDTTTSALTQVTSSIGGGGSETPSINADGTRIAFRSNFDLTGGNPGGGFQIFLATCLPADVEGLITSIVDDLQGIVDSNPGTELAEELADAIDELEHALEELAEMPPDNKHALRGMEDAVEEIEDAIDKGLNPAQGTELMDQLAEVARLLAADAVDQAIARGGDSSNIADAQQALGQGDTLRASGAFKDAISEYGDALSQAEDA